MYRSTLCYLCLLFLLRFSLAFVCLSISKPRNVRSHVLLANDSCAITVVLSDESLKPKLQEHEMMKLLNIELSVVPVPGDFQSQPIDAVCFGSSESVHDWLRKLDVFLGISDCTDEEKRASGNGNVRAICVNTATARSALETGRWTANEIYYPKGNEDKYNQDQWADIALQALGDVIEDKFWG